MILATEKYLNRKFSLRSYNCWDFVCEVWEDLTGNKINAEVANFGWDATRQLATDHAQCLTRLDKPESPCIVLMQRKNATPHVGIYVNRRILHLPPTGPQYQCVQHALMGFPTVSYYK